MFKVKNKNRKTKFRTTKFNTILLSAANIGCTGKRQNKHDHGQEMSDFLQGILKCIKVILDLDSLYVEIFEKFGEGWVLYSLQT